MTLNIYKFYHSMTTQLVAKYNQSLHQHRKNHHNNSQHSYHRHCLRQRPCFHYFGIRLWRHHHHHHHHNYHHHHPQNHHRRRRCRRHRHHHHDHHYSCS